METKTQNIFIFTFFLLTFFTFFCHHLKKKGHPSAHELLGRTYTFWGMFFVLIGSVLLNEIFTFFLFGIISLISLFEFYKFDRNLNLFKSKSFLFTVFFIPIELFFLFKELNYAALILPILLTIIIIPTLIILENNLDQVLKKIGHQTFGILFFLFALNTGPSLLKMNKNIFIGCILYTELRDLASYWIGKILAKQSQKISQSTFLYKFIQYKIAEKISPNKTYLVGFLSIIFLLILNSFVFKNFISQNLINSNSWIVLIGIFGLMGDLAFSLFKREFNLKDSGSFMPGGTGILDRIDALIFTFPITYFYFLIFKA